jgi:integrase
MCVNAVCGVAVFLAVRNDAFPRSHRLLAAWTRLRPPVHHRFAVPLDLLNVIVHVAVRAGDRRLAAVVALAFFGLLRISEVAGLRAAHLALPDDPRLHGGAPARADTVSLVIMVAKTGLEQFTQCSHPLAVQAATWLVNHTPPHQTLAGGRSTSTLRRQFNAIISGLGLDPDLAAHYRPHSLPFACTAVATRAPFCSGLDPDLAAHYRPHSLRSGGATYLFLTGTSLETIAWHGRWASLKSLAAYIQSARANFVLAVFPPDLLDLMQSLRNDPAAIFAEKSASVTAV